MNGPPPGERDLGRLLAGLEPRLDPRAYRIVTVPPEAEPAWAARAFARVVEAEGVTLVAAEEDAGGGDPGAPRWALVTLGVPSALEAVGLMAAVAGRLAGLGIAVNPIAGFHHDHLLVPWPRGREALAALRALAAEARGR